MAVLKVQAPAAAPFTVDDLATDVRLRYRSSRGEHTDRLVTLHHLCGHLRPDGSLNLEVVRGYCHTRKMPRSFQSDRIEGLYDPQTGEVIQDVLAWLGLRDSKT